MDSVPIYKPIKRPASKLDLGELFPHRRMNLKTEESLLTTIVASSNAQSETQSASQTEPTSEAATVAPKADKKRRRKCSTSSSTTCAPQTAAAHGTSVKQISVMELVETIIKDYAEEIGLLRLPAPHLLREIVLAKIKAKNLVTTILQSPVTGISTSPSITTPSSSCKDNHIITENTLIIPKDAKLFPERFPSNSPSSVTSSTSGKIRRSGRCRAIYGINDLQSWCKSCRGKKKCTKFGLDSPPLNTPPHKSSASPVKCKSLSVDHVPSPLALVM